MNTTAPNRRLPPPRGATLADAPQVIDFLFLAEPALDLDAWAKATSTPEAVAAEARRVLDGFGADGLRGGHVFNLGHGINQHTPPENVAVLVETVHKHSRKN